MASSREVAAALLLVLGGCGAGATGGDPAAACREGGLDYRTFGAPYLRSWCTGCHSSGLTGEGRAGAPEGVDFDSYAGVMQHLDGIRLRAAAEVPTMPPRGAAGAAERALLSEWLDCGAP